MSQLLDGLLDAARRTECALHDAIADHAPFCLIPPKEIAMKHALSAARAYAAYEPKTPEPREYEITVLRHGQREECHTGYFADDTEANLEAVRLAGIGGVARVRPLVERSEDDGYQAYPRLLHRNAHPDAQCGWKDAAMKAFSLRSLATERVPSQHDEARGRA
jgi:hypothetical protein